MGVVVSDARRTTILGQRQRPLRGGIRIMLRWPEWDWGLCTLGFNAIDASTGQLSLITNSHCTGGQFTPGATWSAYQTDTTSSADLVAFESETPPCVPWWGLCLKSVDAERFTYAAPASDSVDLGAIARPLGPPPYSYYASGSHTIDPANPKFVIGDEIAFPTGGTLVHRVGLVTGWVSGSVRDTCVWVQLDGDNPHWFYTCQYTVNLSADGGVGGGRWVHHRFGLMPRLQRRQGNRASRVGVGGARRAWWAVDRTHRLACF